LLLGFAPLVDFYQLQMISVLLNPDRVLSRTCGTVRVQRTNLCVFANWI